jgi:uncharacterized Zn-binding protein involved in type VI secretion
MGLGLPAARVFDLHVCTKTTGPIPHVGGPILGPGAKKTKIGGMPAALEGDMALCIGPPDKLKQGSATVKIEGKKAVRMGDQTDHSGIVVLGFPTVLIG